MIKIIPKKVTKDEFIKLWNECKFEPKKNTKNHSKCDIKDNKITKNYGFGTKDN